MNYQCRMKEQNATERAGVTRRRFAKDIAKSSVAIATGAMLAKYGVSSAYAYEIGSVYNGQYGYFTNAGFQM